MKVIIRCPKNRVTKSEMEREIERLFQENKDLRVQVGHLRDELENAKASVEIQRGFREEMAEEIETLEKELAKSERESSQGMNAMTKFWEEAVKEKNKAEERAEEYHIALMESDCRVDELEKQLEWVRNKNEELVQFTASQKDVIAAQKEEKEALEDIVRSFEETRKDYEEEIHAQHVEKREWMQKYEELKAQKEADDKKCEETCAACNELYEDVLAERNHLRGEVERLTNERDTAVNENTALTFDVNDLRDALDVEKELRSRAEHEREEFREKAGKYLDERNTAWDANKRLSGNEETITYYQEIAEKRKEKLDEAMRTITSLNDDIRELEETIDGLNEDKREYAEEIDRLRKVVTNLQSTRFTTDEFIRMIARELMPSTGNSFADSVDF